MRSVQVNFRILIAAAVIGKIECLPLSSKVQGQGNDLGDQKAGFSERGLWSDLLSGIGDERTPVKTLEKKAASPELFQNDLITASTYAPGLQRLQLNPVDSIEDAILAALETVKEQEALAQTTTTTTTPQPPPAPIQNHNGQVSNFNTLPPASYVDPLLLEGQYIDPNQQYIQGVEVETTTVEVPGDFIAGIFGSLGQGNLGGILENTFKLAGSNAVQTFFAGITDTLTCQITPGCTIKRP